MEGGEEGGGVASRDGALKQGVERSRHNAPTGMLTIQGPMERNMVNKLNTDLEEVLDSLRVIAVALSTDPLYLFHLACLTGSLERGG